MVIRVSKILLVAAVAVFALLTAYTNTVNYYGNFPAVQQVFMMEKVSPDATITYRAIHSPVVHHLGLTLIIALEYLTALVCLMGLWKLIRNVKQPAMMFNKAKNMAVAGLTIGFLTWQFIFMTVGGEWFAMWMSPQFDNVIQTAFRIFMMILLVLVYLIHQDDELSGYVEEG